MGFTGRYPTDNPQYGSPLNYYWLHKKKIIGCNLPLKKALKKGCVTLLCHEKVSMLSAVLYLSIFYCVPNFGNTVWRTRIFNCITIKKNISSSFEFVPEDLVSQNLAIPSGGSHLDI